MMNTEIPVTLTKKINIIVLIREMKTSLGVEVGITRREIPVSMLVSHTPNGITKTQLETFLANHKYVKPPAPVTPPTTKELWKLLPNDSEKIKFLGKLKGFD